LHTLERIDCTFYFRFAESFLKGLKSFHVGGAKKKKQDNGEKMKGKKSSRCSGGVWQSDRKGGASKQSKPLSITLQRSV